MSEELKNEIVRRWRNGTPQRAISEALGVSRGRVARVLAKHRAARSGQAAAAAKRPSLLDPYATLIEELLARYPDLTAVRLLEELRSRGFAGSYTIVKERLQRLRPRAPRPPVVRFETAPGAHYGKQSAMLSAVRFHGQRACLT